MVIGVVDPPCGMVTKPTGTPASAKTKLASRVPLIVAERRDGAEQRRDGRRRAQRVGAARNGARHLHRCGGQTRFHDRDRLHVLAGVRERQVELPEAPALHRIVLGADGRPAEVHLRQGVHQTRDGGDVRALSGASAPVLEVVDLRAAAVRGEQGAGARDQRRAGSRAQREPRRRFGQQAAQHLVREETPDRPRRARPRRAALRGRAATARTHPRARARCRPPDRVVRDLRL